MKDFNGDSRKKKIQFWSLGIWEFVNPPFLFIFHQNSRDWSMGKKNKLMQSAYQSILLTQESNPWKFDEKKLRICGFKKIKVYVVFFFFHFIYKLWLTWISFFMITISSNKLGGIKKYFAFMNATSQIYPDHCNKEEATNARYNK